MATTTTGPPAERKHKPRRLTPGFLAFGAVLVWLTMVAPITVLLTWLFEKPTIDPLLASLALAPFAAIGLWRVIQSRNQRLRWPVMQYFGWGAVLSPLILGGSILTIWLPDRSVGLIVLLAWLACGAGGVMAATHIRERRLAFNHHHLDRAYKLVQLSDVHVGSRSASFLRRAVNQALSHKPDVLLITGDLIDASAVQPADLEALSSLPCPVYLSLGNHERYLDLEAVISMIESQGVDILRSQSVSLGKLQIIGIDDADDPEHVENELPPIQRLDDHYRILLYHRPDGWRAARRAGIDLMLSGHTHGGQIWPFNLLVKRRFEHLVGLYSEEGRHLYVSPGTGCWGPIMRLGTRSELTVIELSPKT